MKYIIYGVNRVAKDFVYIFDKLEILYFIENDSNLKSFIGYDVKTIKGELFNNKDHKVILCDFDKSLKEKELKKYGLIYGNDYLYEEDFFFQLDNISIPKDKKIAIWGTGNMCKFLLMYNLPWNVDVFIDTYKKQEYFCERPVCLPSEIGNWRDYYVIVAVEEAKDILNYLSRQGLEESTDFITYIKLLNLPSILLRQTIFEQSYYELECNTMQNHLEILTDGNTRSCCTTFVAQGLDNIFDKTRSELWNSVIHKILYLSTENKTFTFCDKTMCPLFVAKKMENNKLIRIDEKPYKKITEFPETLALGYDSSCNLACITCRKELHFAKDKELEKVKKVEDKVIN